MEATKHRHDYYGVKLFRDAQAEYLRVLHHQNDYWCQRAKQFWLKNGDTNSNFFHRSVKRRQQVNRLTKLKDNNGVWIQRGPLKMIAQPGLLRHLDCLSLMLMQLWTKTIIRWVLVLLFEILQAALLLLDVNLGTVLSNLLRLRQ